jgi:hypothetical protein
MWIVVLYGCSRCIPTGEFSFSGDEPMVPMLNTALSYTCMTLHNHTRVVY